MRIFLLIPIFLFLYACTNKNAATEDKNKGDSEEQVKAVPTVTNLDVKAFDSAIASDEEGILVDVRTPEETELGMIPGAIEIDFYADNFKEKALSLDKEKAIYLYCRSGNRSGQTAEFLISNGYTKVYNLDGGYSGWSDAHKE